MAASTRQRAESSKDPKIEAILNTHLVSGSHTFDQHFDVTEVQRNADSQSRLRTVDKRYVNEIAEKMKAGTIYPPVVLWETDDNGCVLIEGNHRVAAMTKLKVTHIAAYLVKLQSQDEAIYLSAVFNGQNGLRLDPAELRRAVIAASKLRPEPSNQKLAQDYGVSATQVGRIKTEQQMARRLETLAVPGVDSLTQSQLVPLAKISLDEPFKAAASLIIDSGMSTTDVRSMITELAKSGSEAEQLDRIAQERTERHEDIAAIRAGRKSTGSPIVDLRRVVGQVEKLMATYDKPADWVAVDPNVLVNWAPRISNIAAFLGQVQQLYAEAVAALPTDAATDEERADLT